MPLLNQVFQGLCGLHREGYPIGCTVTLRHERMYEFLDRLISVALPRVRDFRGVSGRGFDGRGNYNMGVKEQIIFPEIEYDKIDKIRGLNISITTTAKTDAEAKALAEKGVSSQGNVSFKVVNDSGAAKAVLISGSDIVTTELPAGVATARVHVAAPTAPIERR